MLAKLGEGTRVPGYEGDRFAEVVQNFESQLPVPVLPDQGGVLDADVGVEQLFNPLVLRDQPVLQKLFEPWKLPEVAVEGPHKVGPSPVDHY